MAQQPRGWYNDPTSHFVYRYWDGTQWTNQVSSGGNTSTDPEAMDPSAAKTPPVPGSAAPTPTETTAQPPVQVTQKSSGMGAGVIIGLLLAALAVIVLVVVLMNNASDDPSTTTVAPVTTEAPATTSAPDTTTAP